MTRWDSPLAGAYNFRDLGGLPTIDGATVHYGRLYRSDTLQALTDADKQVLSDSFGVSAVLDLRTVEETADEGRLVLPEACYVSLPLQHVQHVHHATDNRLEATYLNRLRYDANLPIAVELLSTLLSRPTVVHCASGKDRTGITTALVLGLIGVTRDAIVEDYLRTTPALPAIMERFRSQDLAEDLFRCDESTIGTLLDAVERDYCGFAGWARRAGVSDAARQRLRQILLGP